MIDPFVRPADVADVFELTRLEREARAAVVDQRGGARWLDEHPATADWIERCGHDVVLVAELDDVPVGYLVLRIEGPIATVDQVWVTPEAREVGFGDELLASAVAAARSASCAVFEGIALPGDRQTKNLYERAGIVARSITVSTRLDG
jgi:GNAT superfamily N-acetyltransferase